MVSRLGLLLGGITAGVARAQTQLATATPITFHDINILVVTDVHSWISSHLHPDHTPPLTATYGDISSAVLHVQSLAASAGADVFFLNNGDHVEGSGLSDASVYTVGIHGYDLFPLIGMMPFDGLHLGNHDLYDDSTIDYMKNGLSGPAGSGTSFIDHWAGHYLSSNTVNATTQEPIGSTHAILTGPNAGTKILLFGFLYHMTDSCPSVVVQDPAFAVTLPWFEEALGEALEAGVKAIVVLSHMDLSDANVDVLLGAIRGAGDVRLQTMPVQFLTGHTHYRGWAKVDSYSSSFEAGHYLDTLGYMSFDVPSSGETPYFNFQYVDANTDVLKNFTYTDDSTFNTALGDSIDAAIASTIEELGLGKVLGCPTVSYSYSAGLGVSNSLYDLYMNTIIPLALFDVPTGTGNQPYHVTSTGTLRYDVYPGFFYYDDVFAIAPFANVFMYVPGLPGSVVSGTVSALSGSTYLTLEERLRERTERGALDKARVGASLPSYIGGPDGVEESGTYDLFFNDYDEGYVVAALASEMGLSEEEVSGMVVPFRQDRDEGNFIDTTLVWKVAPSELWPC